MKNKLSTKELSEVIDICPELPEEIIIKHQRIFKEYFKLPPSIRKYLIIGYGNSRAIESEFVREIDGGSRDPLNDAIDAFNWDSARRFIIENYGKTLAYDFFASLAGRYRRGEFKKKEIPLIEQDGEYGDDY